MDFKNTAISGVKWTTASTFITALVAVLRLSVLARFLSNEDFGVVAIITLVLGLTQTFADLSGMKKPASQKDTGLSEHYVQWKMNQAFCAFIQAMASGRFRVPS